MTNKELRDLCFTTIKKIQEEDICPLITYCFDTTLHTIRWGDLLLFDSDDYDIPISTFKRMEKIMLDDILYNLKGHQEHITEIQDAISVIMKRRHNVYTEED